VLLIALVAQGIDCNWSMLNVTATISTPMSGMPGFIRGIYGMAMNQVMAYMGWITGWW
jgi:hypothetical protein